MPEPMFLDFELAPREKQASAVRLENGIEETEFFPLPEDFNFQAFHLLRVEVDCLWLKISLDENTICFEKSLESFAPQICLLTESSTAAFSGFALTAGFEDLFEDSNLEKRGWRKLSENGEARVADKNLLLTSRDRSETIFYKEISARDFELAVNFRLVETFGENFRFGFCPAFAETAQAEFFSIEKTGGRWILKAGNSGETFALPESYAPDVFHQIRFLKVNDQIVLRLETETLGIISAPTLSTRIALSAQNASVAFDMIRLTVL